MKLLKSILPKFRVTKGSAPSSASSGGVHAWYRWYYGSHFVFYGMLLLLTLVSVFGGGQTWGQRSLTVILALLLGVWHWATLFRNPQWAQERPLPVLMYFLVAVPLYAGLIWIDPGYQFLTFFFYWYNFSLWRIRWSIPGAAALTVFQIWVNGGLGELWPLSPAIIGGFTISLVVAGVLALYIDSIIGQSAERQQLIEELESTRNELANEERRAGMLEERGRLAREIHDTLAQGFISIVTHLEAAEENLPPGSKPAERHLVRAKRSARENLVEARRLVAALRPEILESSSLPEALQRVTNRWSEETGISANLETTGDYEQLPQDLQVTLLRVAQEALSNVRRHANARQVTLTLSYLEDLIVLDLQDDGTGFDAATSTNDSEGSFGLQAMRERVERLGGQLLIESAPGEGTTLAVQVPLDIQAEKIRSMEKPS